MSFIIDSPNIYIFHLFYCLANIGRDELDWEGDCLRLGFGGAGRGGVTERFRGGDTQWRVFLGLKTGLSGGQAILIKSEDDKC